MNKKVKRLLCLLVMAGMVLSSGCKKTAVQTNGPTLPDMDPYKFKDKVEVSAGKIVANIKDYADGEDPENNEVYRMLDSIMNIKVTNKYAVPFDAYQQKVKLGIAGNDLPDIFFADQASAEELIKNDMVEDIKPYYEKYGTKRLKDIMGFRDNVAFKGVQKGDKFYGMPNVSDSLNGVPVLYIRKDWMEKLGAKTPSTMEEVLDLAVKFAKNDPDSNGKEDTFGFALNKDLDLRFTGLMNAFGAYPKTYLKDSNGKYSYGSVDAKMKDGLAKFAELYKLGVFDKEFATKDLGKMAETTSQGKIGMFIGEFYQPLWPLNDVPKNIKGADWVGIPMPGFNGKEYKPLVPLHVNGFYVVKKGYKNPAALIVMLNNMAESAYDNVDNEWAKKWFELGSNPKYQNKGYNNWMPVALDRPDANESRYKHYQVAKDSSDESKLSASEKNTYNMMKQAWTGDLNTWGWPKTYFEGVKSAISYKNIVMNQWFGSATETEKMKGAALAKLESETFINIIVGNKPVDEFDNFVKQWNDQGGKQMMEEKNNAK